MKIEGRPRKSRIVFKGYFKIEFITKEGKTSGQVLPSFLYKVNRDIPLHFHDTQHIKH